MDQDIKDAHDQLWRDYKRVFERKMNSDPAGPGRFLAAFKSTEADILLDALQKRLTTATAVLSALQHLPGVQAPAPLPHFGGSGGGFPAAGWPPVPGPGPGQGLGWYPTPPTQPWQLSGPASEQSLYKGNRRHQIVADYAKDRIGIHQFSYKASVLHQKTREILGYEGYPLAIFSKSPDPSIRVQYLQPHEKEEDLVLHVADWYPKYKGDKACLQHHALQAAVILDGAGGAAEDTGDDNVGKGGKGGARGGKGGKGGKGGNGGKGGRRGQNFGGRRA